MQQVVILLLVNCSSTCFGRLYAHHHEVRLRFTAYGFLSYCSCCDAGESDGKMCALRGVGCLTCIKQLSLRVHTSCKQKVVNYNISDLKFTGQKLTCNILIFNYVLKEAIYK